MLRTVLHTVPVLLAAAAFGTAADDKKPFDDATFVTMAASGNMLEAKLGDAAVGNAKASDVMNFGKQMAADHAKANEDLRTAATSAGLAFPTAMSDEHQKEFDSMKKLTDVSFDRAYTKHAVTCHEEAVKWYGRAAKEAKTPALKDYATKTLPVLEKHLEMAKALAEKK